MNKIPDLMPAQTVHILVEIDGKDCIVWADIIWTGFQQVVP